LGEYIEDDWGRETTENCLTRIINEVLSGGEENTVTAEYKLSERAI
jgi:hypothetical protein